jgi:hypothetical protein
MVGMAIVFVIPRLAAAGDAVFLKIKTKAAYLNTIIKFDVKEGAVDNPSEIEVLRAEKKSGDYQVVGLVNYEVGKNSYVFEDKTVEKTSYYYKLRFGGQEIISKPFRGRALLLPPST